MKTKTAKKRVAKHAPKTSSAAKASKPAKPQSLAFHPLSELLPLMNPAELAALKDDIEANGQRDPIVLLDGKILDGRNRYTVLTELGRATVARDFNSKKEGSPVNYVYSKAVHRNLTDSQKACAAVGFLEHFERDAEARMRLGKKPDPKELVPEGQTGQARDQAGELFGVSGRYISEAKALKANAADLFKTVFDGALPITRAKREYQRRVKHAALCTRAASISKGEAVEGDAWRVIHGDCRVELPKLDAKAPLVFADPPYNEGLDYGQGAEGDKKSYAEFLRWTGDWIDKAVDAMTDDGSIFTMINTRYQAQLYGLLAQVGLHFRNTIVWHETFGNYTSSNFTNCTRYVHYFTRHPTRFTWNESEILIPSDRQEKYADKRANAAGKVPGNVWEFPRLVDNAKERMPGFPTQVPVALVERIVRVASNPGDLVIDPFNGSGTTGHAALLHGRRYVGIEQVAANAEYARNRLAAVAAERSNAQ